MTRWAAFLGLTGVVLALLLALARLSQQVVRGDDGAEADIAENERGFSAPPAAPGAGVDDAGQSDATAQPSDAGAAVETTDGLDSTEQLGPEEETSTEAVGHTTETTGHPGRAPLAGETPELTTGALLANVAFTQGLFGGILVAGAWYFEIPAAALGLAPVVTGGLGLVLAAGYVVTGSLAVVVVAHYLVNALEFLVHEYLGVGRLL